MLPDLKTPKERQLFFTDQVDQKSISELTKAIININVDDDSLEPVYKIHSLEYKRRPIEIFIDSYGGYLYQCLGLLGVIENSTTPIHTIVTGCAMSCGFMMLISGHRRFAFKYSTAMYHQVSSWYSGKVQDLKEDLQETERLQSLIETITMQRTSIKVGRLKDVRERKIDWCMDAQEALRLKVVDEII